MADGFEEEIEPTISIGGYLEGVEEQELEADLVLGGDEGKECTYNKGYLKRQAIFSYLTCTPDGNAGICTACSLSCHDGHEIPRDEEGEPSYEDLLCQGCSNICFFLTLYSQKIRVTVRQLDVSISAKDKEVIQNAPSPSGSSETLQNGDCSLDTSTRDSTSGAVFVGKGILLGEIKAHNTVLLESSQTADPSKTCILGKNLLEAAPEPEKSKAMSFCKNWREVLCRCENCLEFYTRKRISFLLDREDSIAEYEKRDENLQQQKGQELNFLSKLGHIEKMEVLSGIADMKNEIHSFLESFDASKPITADDVHQVFENLAKKRRHMP